MISLLADLAYVTRYKVSSQAAEGNLIPAIHDIRHGRLGVIIVAVVLAIASSGAQSANLQAANQQAANGELINSSVPTPHVFVK